MNFITLDIGGADLTIEINTQGAVLRKDRSGTSSVRSYSGKIMVTKTYGDKFVLTGTTKWLTTNEYQALVAAAQYPETIVVGGEALRTTDNNAVPETINATALIEEVDYIANGVDFLHIAKITIEESE